MRCKGGGGGKGRTTPSRPFSLGTAAGLKHLFVSLSFSCRLFLALRLPGSHSPLCIIPVTLPGRSGARFLLTALASISPVEGKGLHWSCEWGFRKHSTVIYTTNLEKAWRTALHYQLGDVDSAGWSRSSGRKADGLRLTQRMEMEPVIGLLLGSLLWTGAVAPFSPDLIQPHSLPNVNFQVRFKQYSGFLDASVTHKFHYWLTESQGSPATDPLILWLSGGPGCSSVDGLLQELGPFYPHANGARVDENPYTWSKLGNVLYIESPAGVGFSFATDGNLTTSDDQTARDNYGALISFLNKFQEYRGRPLYITGESYAGVYLPTLAVLLAKDKQNFPNFKGMAIGNGLLNYPFLVNDLMPMLYYHGLVSETQWAGMIKCCNGTPSNCNYFSFIQPNTVTTPSISANFTHPLLPDQLDMRTVDEGCVYDAQHHGPLQPVLPLLHTRHQHVQPGTAPLRHFPPAGLQANDPSLPQPSHAP